MTERVETRLDGTTLVVRIPMRFQRRGGRKRIVAPDWSLLVPATERQPDGTWSKRSPAGALAEATRSDRLEMVTVGRGSRLSTPDQRGREAVERETKRPGATPSRSAQTLPAEVAVGELALVPPPPARLDPTTRLRKGGCLLGEKAHVLDFWSWAFSDLRQNSVRGHLAEYIVGLALGVPLTVRSAWDDYDLLVPAGTVARGSIRLQVKSAAYLQAWGQRKLSAITFGGLRRRPFPWSAEQGFVLGETKCPKADVFVFAIETARQHDDYDPLEINQWAFRVLPAHLITRDTLSLGTLSKLARGGDL